MLPFVSFTWSPGWRLSALTHVRRLFILSRQGYEVDCMVSNAAPAFTYIQINQYSSQAVKIFELPPFWKVWLTKDVQRDLAANSLIIPMVKGAGDVIQNPFLRRLAQEIKDSDWIGIAMDQLLGPDTGRLFNAERCNQF
jgi:hypothetical protein